MATPPLPFEFLLLLPFPFPAPSFAAPVYGVVFSWKVNFSNISITSSGAERKRNVFDYIPSQQLLRQPSLWQHPFLRAFSSGVLPLPSWL
jgi:hypothetical protein